MLPTLSQHFTLQEAFETVERRVKIMEFGSGFSEKFKLLVDRFSSFIRQTSVENRLRK